MRTPTVGASLTAILAVCGLLSIIAWPCFAQRPRPSRPIPPPSPVESFTVLIDRTAFPGPLHLVAQWQPPDGETSVYHANAMFVSSHMGPGDHVVSEMDVPPLPFANNPSRDTGCPTGTWQNGFDERGECSPWCMRILDLGLGRYVCNCAFVPMVVTVPSYVSNGAEAFMVSEQWRRVVVTIHGPVPTNGVLVDRMLAPAMAFDLYFTNDDLRVPDRSPTLRRRATR